MFNPSNFIPVKENEFSGRFGFAANIAKAMLKYQNTNSLVIGLYGEEGSGKSVIGNSIITELKNCTCEDDAQIPVIVKFNPCNFSDQNQLLSQLINPIAEAATQRGLSKGINKITNSEDLQETKKLISEELQNINSKIIIFIDNIDILNKIQIRQVLQTIKFIGDFPNTIYFLMFDKSIVVKSLAGAKSEEEEEGENYLKKIIQIPIELPKLNHDQVLTTLKENLSRITSFYPASKFEQEYFQSVFDKCVKPFIKNLQDVNCLMNSFEFKYYLMKDEVDVSDLLAISAYEIFTPDIHKWIRDSKEFLLGELCQFLLSHQKINREELLKSIKPMCSGYSPQVILDGICEIFPFASKLLLCTKKTKSDRDNTLESENRLANPSKFKNYFSLSVKENLPHEVTKEEIKDLINNAPLENIIVAFKRCNHLTGIFLKELNSNTEIVPPNRRRILIDAILYAYPELCNLKFDLTIFKIEGWIYAMNIAKNLLSKLNADERLDFLSSDMSKYPKLSIFLFLNLLENDMRFYGKWNLESAKNYEPLFADSQLEDAEKKVLSMILSVVSKDFIFELDNKHFWSFIFIWKKVDSHNPQIADMIKSFINV